MLKRKFAAMIELELEILKSVLEWLKIKNHAVKAIILPLLFVMFAVIANLFNPSDAVLFVVAIIVGDGALMMIILGKWINTPSVSHPFLKYKLYQLVFWSKRELINMSLLWMSYFNIVAILTAMALAILRISFPVLLVVLIGIAVGLIVCVIFILLWLYQKYVLRIMQCLPPLDNIYETLTNWAYHVEIYISDAMPKPVRKPLSVSEVQGQVVNIEGVTRLHFYAPCQSGEDISNIDTDEIKDILQSGFDMCLQDSKLSYQPFAADGTLITHIDGVPLIKIADVTKEAHRLAITAFWVNNASMAKYVNDYTNKPQIIKGEHDEPTDDEY